MKSYKKPRALRLTALAVLLCFLTSQGGPEARAFSAPEGPSIPQKFVHLEESFQGTSGKTLLFIQDAHESLEAQENIAKAIQYFVGSQGVKTVYEEGYEGEVPTDSYFAFIHDPKIRRRVSYFFLDKLRIGGAEFAHINREKDFKLIGADSIKLHLENIAQYQKASARQKEVAEDLRAVLTEFEKLGNSHYSEKIKIWLKLRGRFDSNRLPLPDYLKRTAGLLADTRAYPLISLLISPGINQDREKLKKLEAMDPRQLFSEIDRMENDLAQKELKGKEELKIFQYQKEIMLLVRLNNLEVSAPEYETAQAVLEKLQTRELAEFIARESKRTQVLSREWEEEIRHALDFYKIANARDREIERGIEGFLKNPDENTAVLVFGGFHKNAVKSFLRSRNISYQILSPIISGEDAVHRAYYRELMSEGFYDFEKIAAPSRAARPQTLMTLPQARSEIRGVYRTALDKPDLEYPLFEKEAVRAFNSPAARSELRKMFAVEDEVVRVEIAQTSGKYVLSAYNLRKQETEPRVRVELIEPLSGEEEPARLVLGDIVESHIRADEFLRRALYVLLKKSSVQMVGYLPKTGSAEEMDKIFTWLEKQPGISLLKGNSATVKYDAAEVLMPGYFIGEWNRIRSSKDYGEQVSDFLDSLLLFYSSETDKKHLHDFLLFLLRDPDFIIRRQAVELMLRYVRIPVDQIFLHLENPDSGPFRDDQVSLPNPLSSELATANKRLALLVFLSQISQAVKAQRWAVDAYYGAVLRQRFASELETSAGDPVFDIANESALMESIQNEPKAGLGHAGKMSALEVLVREYFRYLYVTEVRKQADPFKWLHDDLYAMVPQLKIPKTEALIIRMTSKFRSELRTENPWDGRVREVRLNADRSAASVVFEDGKTVELTEKFEEGAYHEFFAYHENGRRLLLKVMKPGLDGDRYDKGVKSLENEARISDILRRVKHMQNVTNVIWLGTIPGSGDALLISGPEAQSLKDWRERLTLQERGGVFRQYVEQIFQAYSGPERESVSIHDLKPANGLLKVTRNPDGSLRYTVHVIDLEAGKMTEDIPFRDIWRGTYPYLPNAELIAMLMTELGRHKTLGLVGFMELLIFFQDFVLDDDAMNGGTANVEKFLRRKDKAVFENIVKKISDYEKYRKIWYYEEHPGDPVDLNALFADLIESLRVIEGFKVRKVLFVESWWNWFAGFISMIFRKLLALLPKRTRALPFEFNDAESTRLPAAPPADDGISSEAPTPRPETAGTDTLSQFRRLMFLLEALGPQFSERDFVRKGNRTVRELSSLYLIEKAAESNDALDVSIYEQAENDVRRVYGWLKRPVDSYAEDTIRYIREKFITPRSELRTAARVEDNGVKLREILGRLIRTRTSGEVVILPGISQHPAVIDKDTLEKDKKALTDLIRLYLKQAISLGPPSSYYLPWDIFPFERNSIELETLVSLGRYLGFWKTEPDPGSKFPSAAILRTYRTRIPLIGDFNLHGDSVKEGRLAELNDLERLEILHRVFAEVKTEMETEMLPGYFDMSGPLRFDSFREIPGIDDLEDFERRGVLGKGKEAAVFSAGTGTLPALLAAFTRSGKITVYEKNSYFLAKARKAVERLHHLGVLDEGRFTWVKEDWRNQKDDWKKFDFILLPPAGQSESPASEKEIQESVSAQAVVYKFARSEVRSVRALIQQADHLERTGALIPEVSSQFVNRHMGPYRTALQLLTNRILAEDLSDDAFLELWTEYLKALKTADLPLLVQVPIHIVAVMRMHGAQMASWARVWFSKPRKDWRRIVHVLSAEAGDETLMGTLLRREILPFMDSYMNARKREWMDEKTPEDRAARWKYHWTQAGENPGVEAVEKAGSDYLEEFIQGLPVSFRQTDPGKDWPSQSQSLLEMLSPAGDGLLSLIIEAEEKSGLDASQLIVQFDERLNFLPAFVHKLFMNDLLKKYKVYLLKIWLRNLQEQAGFEYQAGDYFGQVKITIEAKANEGAGLKAYFSGAPDWKFEPDGRTLKFPELSGVEDSENRPGMFKAPGVFWQILGDFQLKFLEKDGRRILVPIAYLEEVQSSTGYRDIRNRTEHLKSARKLNRGRTLAVDAVARAAAKMGVLVMARGPETASLFIYNRRTLAQIDPGSRTEIEMHYVSPFSNTQHWKKVEAPSYAGTDYYLFEGNREVLKRHGWPEDTIQQLLRSEVRRDPRENIRMDLTENWRRFLNGEAADPEIADQVERALKSKLDHYLLITALIRLHVSQAVTEEQIFSGLERLMESVSTEGKEYLSILGIILSQRNFAEGFAGLNPESGAFYFDLIGMTQTGDVLPEVRPLNQRNEAVGALLNLDAPDKKTLMDGVRDVTGEKALTPEDLNPLTDIVRIQAGDTQDVYMISALLKDGRRVPFILMAARGRTALRAVRREFENFEPYRDDERAVHVIGWSQTGNEAGYTSRFSNTEEIIYVSMSEPALHGETPGNFTKNSDLPLRVGEIRGAESLRKITAAFASAIVYFYKADLKRSVQFIVSSAGDLNFYDSDFQPIAEQPGKYEVKPEVEKLRTRLIAFRGYNDEVDPAHLIAELFDFTYFTPDSSDLMTGPVHDDAMIQGVLDGLVQGLEDKLKDPVLARKTAMEWLQAYLNAFSDYENPVFGPPINVIPEVRGRIARLRREVKQAEKRSELRVNPKSEGLDLNGYAWLKELPVAHFKELKDFLEMLFGLDQSGKLLELEKRERILEQSAYFLRLFQDRVKYPRGFDEIPPGIFAHSAGMFFISNLSYLGIYRQLESEGVLQPGAVKNLIELGPSFWNYSSVLQKAYPNLQHALGVDNDPAKTAGFQQGAVQLLGVDPAVFQYEIADFKSLDQNQKIRQWMDQNGKSDVLFLQNPEPQSRPGVFFTVPEYRDFLARAGSLLDEKGKMIVVIDEDRLDHDGNPELLSVIRGLVYQTLTGFRIPQQAGFLGMPELRKVKILAIPQPELVRLAQRSEMRALNFTPVYAVEERIELIEEIRKQSALNSEPPFVILEGGKGSGKSTLARQIAGSLSQKEPGREGVVIEADWFHRVPSGLTAQLRRLAGLFFWMILRWVRILSEEAFNQKIFEAYFDQEALQRFLHDLGSARTSSEPVPVKIRDHIKKEDVSVLIGRRTPVVFEGMLSTFLLKGWSGIRVHVMTPGARARERYKAREKQKGKGNFRIFMESHDFLAGWFNRHGRKVQFDYGYVTTANFLKDSAWTMIQLSGGKGTRMGPGVPKPLRQLKGKPLFEYSLDTAKRNGLPVIAVGSSNQDLRKALKPRVQGYVEEESSVESAFFSPLSKYGFLKGNLVFIGGDTVITDPSILRSLMLAHEKKSLIPALMTFSTVRVSNPQGLDRVVRDSKGRYVTFIKQEEIEWLRSSGQTLKLGDGTELKTSELDAINEVWPAVIAMSAFAYRILGFLLKFKDAFTVPKFVKKKTISVDKILNRGARRRFLMALGAVRIHQIEQKDAILNINTPQQLEEAERTLTARSELRTSQAAELVRDLQRWKLGFHSEGFALEIYAREILLLKELGILNESSSVFSFLTGADFLPGLFAGKFYSTEKRFNAEQMGRIWSLTAKRDAFKSNLPVSDAEMEALKAKTEHEQADVLNPEFIKRWTGKMKAGDTVYLRFVPEHLSDGVGRRDVRKIETWLDQLITLAPDGVHFVIFDFNESSLPGGTAGYLQSRYAGILTDEIKFRLGKEEYLEWQKINEWEILGRHLKRVSLSLDGQLMDLAQGGRLTVLTKPPARSESRNLPDAQPPVEISFEKIDGFMQEIRSLMARKPWNLYNISEKEEYVADAAKAYLEKIQGILESVSAEVKTSKDAVRLRLLETAAEDFDYFLNVLILLENRELKEVSWNRLEKGQGIHHYFKFDYKSRTYSVEVFARWSRGQGPEARFEINFPQQDRESFRLDLSSYLGNSRASFDMPTSVRKLVPDHTELFHHNIPDLSYQENFQNYVIGLDQKISRSELRGSLPLIETSAKKPRRDPELVEKMKLRITVVGATAEDIAKGQQSLDSIFEKEKNRNLSVYEQDLFDFYVNGEGRDVPLEYRPGMHGGTGYFGNDNDKGRPYVWFSDGRMISSRFRDPRSPFEIFKHEASHTMDAIMERKGDSNLKGYAGFQGQTNSGVDIFYVPQHRLVYQEFRANLWTYDGNPGLALKATLQSYPELRTLFNGIADVEKKPAPVLYTALKWMSRDMNDQLYPDSVSDIGQFDQIYIHWYLEFASGRVKKLKRSELRMEDINTMNASELFQKLRDSRLGDLEERAELHRQWSEVPAEKRRRGVGMIVLRKIGGEWKVLFGRQNHGRYNGKYVAPSGGVDKPFDPVYENAAETEILLKSGIVQDFDGARGGKESAQAAVLRELKEETGIEGRIAARLADRFAADDGLFMTYFIHVDSGEDETVPERDGEIEPLIWVPLSVILKSESGQAGQTVEREFNIEFVPGLKRRVLNILKDRIQSLPRSELRNSQEPYEKRQGPTDFEWVTLNTARFYDHLRLLWSLTPNVAKIRQESMAFSDEERESFFDWIVLPSPAMPPAESLRKILHLIVEQRILASQSKNSDAILNANDWADVLAYRWKVPPQVLQALFLWMARSSIRPSEVSSQTLIDFMNAFISSYTEGRPKAYQWTHFGPAIPAGESAEAKLNRVTASINTAKALFGEDFVRGKTRFISRIGDSPYYIGFGFGFASEDPFRPTLILGEWKDGQKNVFERVFFKMSFDIADTGRLQIVTLKGIKGKETVITDFRSAMGGSLGPGRALLTAAAVFARKYSYREVLGLKGEHHTTAPDGKPLNYSAIYKGFGLRKNSKEGPWQSTDVLFERFSRIRAAGDANAQSLTRFLEVSEKILPAIPARSELRTEEEDFSKSLRHIELKKSMTDVEIKKVSDGYPGKTPMRGKTPVTNNRLLTKILDRQKGEPRFPSLLAGKHVLLIGPSPEGDDLEALIRRYPGIGNIYLVDADERVFIGNDRKLQDMQASGIALPKVEGYKINALELPGEWTEQVDVAIHAMVIDQFFFNPAQIGQFANEMVRVLKPGGAELSVVFADDIHAGDGRIQKINDSLHLKTARSEIRLAAVQPTLNVRQSLKNLKTPALVYLDYKNLMEKFWDSEKNTWNEQGMEIIAMTAMHPDKIRLVISGADLMDDRLKAFRDLRDSGKNVRITDLSAAEAYEASQKDFIKGWKNHVSIHLSKDLPGLKNSFNKTQQSEIYFFRYARQDRQGGLLAAALLWAQYAEDGKTMDGVTRDEEGFLTLTEGFIRQIIQKYEARLVVAFSA